MGHIRTRVTAALVAVLAALSITLTGTAAHAGGQSVPHNWTRQTSHSVQPLYDVSCFTATRCKAVGAAGTIRYTKNGGVTWRDQHNPLEGSQTPLTRIACVAPQTCYVVAPPSTVLITHNGGASWTTAALPVSATSTVDSTCMKATTYANHDRLNICRSGVTDVACTDANTCYVTASPNAVYRTVDGGATWTPQTVPATVQCDGDCTPAMQYRYPLGWVSCPTANACYAGGSVFVGSHEGFAAAVLTMTGAGNPWTRVLKGTLAFSPDDAVCPHPGHCIGVFSTSPFDPGTSIFRSDDGGLTWSDHPSGSKRVRNAVACSATTVCVSVGNQGSITGTNNGTLFFGMKSPTSRNLFGVTCVNAVVCYAVGNLGTIVARR